MTSENRPTGASIDMKQKLMVGALEEYRTLLIGNSETPASLTEVELLDEMLRDLNADG